MATAHFITAPTRRRTREAVGRFSFQIGTKVMSAVMRKVQDATKKRLHGYSKF